jgi:CspA family cold shock protein
LAGQSGRLAFATAGARSDPLQTSKTKFQVARSRDLISSALMQRKATAMTNGTVKFYNEQKGFGFIQPDDGGKDVFVHVSALERAGMGSLSEGQKVSFDTQQDSRSGKTAVGNIKAA